MVIIAQRRFLLHGIQQKSKGHTILQSIRFGYLLVFFAVVACGDIDDNNSHNPMRHWVGRWKFKNATDNDPYIGVIEFKSDGTYGQAFQSIHSGKSTKLQLLGTYSVTEDRFEFIDHLSAFEKRVRSRGTWAMPDGNTLELHYDHDDRTIYTYYRLI